MNRIHTLLLFCISLLLCSCNKDSLPEGFSGEIPNLRIKSMVETTERQPVDRPLIRTIYTTTFRYDSENRLLEKSRQWLDDNQQERETRQEFSYENGKLVEMRQYDSSIDDPAFIVLKELYEYDEKGRIEEKGYCYNNANQPNNPYCYTERFIYGSNDKVKRVDHYSANSTERSRYRVLEWAGDNLLWEEQYQGDKDARLYVRYDMVYDDKINPYYLIENTSEDYRKSVNNVVRQKALDGGWYHGPDLLNFQLEYTEDGLPKTSWARYFYNVETKIQVDYEYEEIP